MPFRPGTVLRSEVFFKVGGQRTVPFDQARLGGREGDRQSDREIQRETEGGGASQGRVSEPGRGMVSVDCSRPSLSSTPRLQTHLPLAADESPACCTGEASSPPFCFSPLIKEPTSSRHDRRSRHLLGPRAVVREVDRNGRNVRAVMREVDRNGHNGLSLPADGG